MSSQNSEISNTTSLESQSQTTSVSSLPASQDSSFSNLTTDSEISSFSSVYDTQDENLSQELDSDWSESDDEINDPTWTPSLES